MWLLRVADVPVQPFSPGHGGQFAPHLLDGSVDFKLPTKLGF